MHGPMPLALAMQKLVKALRISALPTW